MNFKIISIIGQILILLAFAGSATAGARTTPSQKGTQESSASRDELFLQALSILPEEKIPLQWRDAVSEAPPTTRCATFLIMETRARFQEFSPQQQTLLNSLLQRPTLPLSMSTPSGRFKIHYTISGIDAVPLQDVDGNGTPDFVEEVGLAFENSYTHEITQLAYREPPDDAGTDGPEYDIYIQDLGSRYYGFTQGEGGIPETPQQDLRSYIVIDNDFNNGHFTTGIDGARVTAAHEYFHAIQFGYRVYQNSEEPFYYEFCSVWMEDVVYDNINDYYQYLPSFFRNRNLPFNKFTNSNLGEAIWNFFLVKKYGDTDLVKRTWEIMQSDALATAAINQALQEKGSNFGDAFAEFAVWNYFTGSRAQPMDYYDESPMYPEVSLKGSFSLNADTTIVDSSLSSTHSYYKFTVASEGPLAISGQVDVPANWRFVAIVTRPDNQVTTDFFNILAGQRYEFLPRLTELIVIPVNAEVIDGDDLPFLGFKTSTYTFSLSRVLTQPGTGNNITNVYPNPFFISQNSQINFQFETESFRELEVRILNVNGKVIKTAKFGEKSSLGTTNFIWNGLDDTNAKVASGIYLFQLKVDDSFSVKKFAVVRE